MATSPGWGGRLLYAFFVAQIDETGHAMPRESIGRAFVDLFERLRTTLGGMTTIKTIEALGETAAWGAEQTTLVLVLADQTQERAADSIIADEARRLRLHLVQDEVWVTKQEIQLFLAR